jgi:SsrA-binding protein
MIQERSTATARIVNKKARHSYEVLDRLEVGIALSGSEVKSVRGAQVSLNEAFARIVGGEVVLYGCHISPYEQAGRQNHDPLRPRKLLLHRREIKRLASKVREKGQTLVPLTMYFTKRGLAKVDLALVRGKSSYDKRQNIKRREHEREMNRATGRR